MSTTMTSTTAAILPLKKVTMTVATSIRSYSTIDANSGELRGSFIREIVMKSFEVFTFKLKLRRHQRDV